MAKTLEQEAELLGRPMLGYKPDDSRYKKAWEQFDRMSHRLKLLWKTKKSVLQIMKDERLK